MAVSYYLVLGAKGCVAHLILPVLLLNDVGVNILTSNGISIILLAFFYII